MGATATPTVTPITMQGIQVPAAVVNPQDFFALTRRKTLLEKQLAFSTTTAAGGAVATADVVELRKSDILALLTIRFVGTLTVTTAAVTPTARWPYDLLKSVRFTANGASNLVNLSGAKLKVREQTRRGDENDRGVSQMFNGATRTQGTLAMACEAWGAGPLTSTTPGTYAVDLTWHVPVAEDEVDLAGAIFLATSTSDLTLSMDYETPANLFTGSGVATLTGNFQVATTKYSIPTANQAIIVPDLSTFHSLVQSNYSSIANGENEVRVVGQGAGKAMLRMMYQLWNGAGTASAPLAMTTANFGKQSWRFGNNETPEEYPDGSFLRAVNERTFSSDVGGLWGYGVHDFANEHAFRDVVDMGATGELRLVTNVATSVALASPRLELVLETMFSANA
jgi:hypothetical protein